MKRLVPHILYLFYVLRHKLYVFVECCKLGILWRGITHDLSKFSRGEWGPYVERFYGSGSRDGFDGAWFHHYSNNDHHWEYWAQNKSDVQPMSTDSIREMVADWRAMAKTQGGTAKEFYVNNKEKFILTHTTEQLVECFLNYEG
jgi:hypothetical protein